MVATPGALSAGSAHQPDDAGSRRAITVDDVAEVVEFRCRREIWSASSEKLRGLAVLPSNKPLQVDSHYKRHFSSPEKDVR